MILEPVNAIFIHVPRTGGTSIELALGKYFFKDTRIDYDGLIYLKADKHRSYAWFERMLKGEIKNKFVFSFVRNPWARMVSWYFHSQHSKKLKRHSKTRDFKSFIKHCIGRSPFRKSQLGYLQNENRKVEVDFIGRYETLERDFHIVCKKLGIKNLELPSFGATHHDPYQAYYDEKSKQIVYDCFYKEIELFSFSTDWKPLLPKKSISKIKKTKKEKSSIEKPKGNSQKSLLDFKFRLNNEFQIFATKIFVSLSLIICLNIL